MKKLSKLGSLAAILVIIIGSIIYYNIGAESSTQSETKTDSTEKTKKDSIVIDFGEKSPFKKGILFDTSGNSQPFRILFPDNFDTSKNYPLVIFYHGAGERGSDNEKQLIHVSNLFLSDDFRKNYPAFVLLPQCPEDIKWVDADWTEDFNVLKDRMTDPLRLSKVLIENISEIYKTDTTKYYAIGMSMGGFGVWDIISRYPDLFAAVIPICGGGDLNYAEKIKDVPIWAFHGDSDKLVKVSRTRDMITAIKNAGGNPKYTEYRNTGHGSWINAFSEPGFFKWLFSNQRK